MASTFVVYYRRSTKKQSLSLHAQEEMVGAFLRSYPGDVLESFTDTESGSNDDRPNLQRAVDLCSVTNATLLVAKLDRLGRSLHLITTLQKAGVKFQACDNPHANELTVHILAAVAQDELQRIRSRTREALAKAKQQGVLMGRASPLYGTGEGSLPAEIRKERIRAGAANGGKASGKVRSQRAEQRKRVLRDMIQPLRDQGKTLEEIAETLNRRGITTTQGKDWTKGTVCHALR